MDTINFKNREFKIREVEFSEIGNVLISTNSLNESLLNEFGAYASNEAIEIDENIFYFVNDSEIELSDIELINLIIEEIK
jgi:hypothetical protein